MPIDFYYALLSPPCRSVLMLGKILGIEFNLIPVNFMEKTHHTPEFLKINPEHTIPTIVDNGFPVWESRAILTYLADKYGNDDNDLYPKDLKKRTKINQRLYFDAILGEKFHEYYFAKHHNKEANPDAKKIEENLAFLDAALEGQKYITGDKLTIADLSLFINITTFNILGGDVTAKFKNVNRWIVDFKTVPGYEIYENGLVATKKLLNQMKQKSKANEN